MTKAHRTAEQLQMCESVQPKHNRKFFSLCAPFRLLTSPVGRQKTVSLCCDEAAELRGALVPLLCYLLYSHAPGTRWREAVRDVTHIRLQQREREVERVEQHSDTWSISSRQRRHLQRYANTVCTCYILLSLYCAVSLCPFIYYLHMQLNMQCNLAGNIMPQLHFQQSRQHISRDGSDSLSVSPPA